jgi:uncharacterized membrane protein
MTSTPIGKASAKIVAGELVTGFALGGVWGLVAAIGLIVLAIGVIELVGIEAKRRRKADEAEEPEEQHADPLGETAVKAIIGRYGLKN